MKKKILLAAVLLLVIAAAAAALLRSGILVKPTAASLAKDKPVQSYDLLEEQQQREEAILADYALDRYTLQKPYLIQDPYHANPLSALLIFETESPAKIQVTVKGKDAPTTFTYTSPDVGTHHEVAVLGLYAGQKTSVELRTIYPDGHSESAEQLIETEALPSNFPSLDVQVSKPEKMEPGLDLMTACLTTNYTYLLDAHGDVRGYFSNKNFGHCNAMHILKNGRLLATGDTLKMMPYNMYTIWEMNLLGKVFVEYDIPNAVHHDIVELENGDFLAASNNPAMPMGYDSREDVIIRIDRASGMVEQEFNLRAMLDDSRKPYNHYDPGVINAPNHDWAHLNSVVLDEASNSILASSPIQSAVVKFDAATEQIDWILGPHDGWNSQFQPFLLTPSGANFEWQWGQHDTQILPDRDNDANTTDILLFDNGQARSFSAANSLNPADNYSRAVIYRVHEAQKTVEQLWQYGKERGSEAYATFLGSAEPLAQTGNINIMFGGMLRQNGVPVDDIVTGVLGQQEIRSRVVEVQADGEVVFDALATPRNNTDAATYQVRKIALYTAEIESALGQSKGQRKGEIQAAQQVHYTLPQFFIPAFTFTFEQIYKRDNRLVIQGRFLFHDQAYMLGKILFVLKNSQNEYIFPANPGINGNFETRIDLHGIEAGEYAIYAAGGVVSGMDARGKIQSGYNPTGYKIRIP